LRAPAASICSRAVCAKASLAGASSWGSSINTSSYSRGEAKATAHYSGVSAERTPGYRRQAWTGVPARVAGGCPEWLRERAGGRIPGSAEGSIRPVLEGVKFSPFVVIRAASGWADDGFWLRFLPSPRERRGRISEVEIESDVEGEELSWAFERLARVPPSEGRRRRPAAAARARAAVPAAGARRAGRRGRSPRLARPHAT
jgi:hypothetical protein